MFCKWCGAAMEGKVTTCSRCGKEQPPLERGTGFWDLCDVLPEEKAGKKPQAEADRGTVTLPDRSVPVSGSESAKGRPSEEKPASRSRSSQEKPTSRGKSDHRSASRRRRRNIPAMAALGVSVLLLLLVVKLGADSSGYKKKYQQLKDRLEEAEENSWGAETPGEKSGTAVNPEGDVITAEADPGAGEGNSLRDITASGAVENIGPEGSCWENPRASGGIRVETIPMGASGQVFYYARNLDLQVNTEYRCRWERREADGTWTVCAENTPLLYVDAADSGEYRIVIRSRKEVPEYRELIFDNEVRGQIPGADEEENDEVSGTSRERTESVIYRERGGSVGDAAVQIVEVAGSSGTYLCSIGEEYKASDRVCVWQVSPEGREDWRDYHEGDDCLIEAGDGYRYRWAILEVRYTWAGPEEGAEETPAGEPGDSEPVIEYGSDEEMNHDSENE